MIWRFFSRHRLLEVSCIPSRRDELYAVLGEARRKQRKWQISFVGITMIVMAATLLLTTYLPVVSSDHFVGKLFLSLIIR